MELKRLEMMKGLIDYKGDHQSLKDLRMLLLLLNIKWESIILPFMGWES
jgi:hypothetical protein